MRERGRVTRWGHAAARLGAVAGTAGVLVGGGIAGVFLGGGIDRQAHAVVRTVAEISHPPSAAERPQVGRGVRKFVHAGHQNGATASGHPTAGWGCDGR
jgi:hypothetical protein